jgi:hypothetical protein
MSRREVGEKNQAFFLSSEQLQSQEKSFALLLPGRATPVALSRETRPTHWLNFSLYG